MTRKLLTAVLLAIVVASCCFSFIVYNAVGHLPPAETAFVVWLTLMPGVLTCCLVIPELSTRRISMGSWAMLVICSAYLTTAFVRDDEQLLVKPFKDYNMQFAAGAPSAGSSKSLNAQS